MPSLIYVWLPPFDVFLLLFVVVAFAFPAFLDEPACFPALALFVPSFLPWVVLANRGQKQRLRRILSWYGALSSSFRWLSLWQQPIDVSRTPWNWLPWWWVQWPCLMKKMLLTFCCRLELAFQYLPSVDLSVLVLFLRWLLHPCYRIRAIRSIELHVIRILDLPFIFQFDCELHAFYLHFSLAIMIQNGHVGLLHFGIRLEIIGVSLSIGWRWFDKGQVANNVTIGTCVYNKRSVECIDHLVACADHLPEPRGVLKPIPLYMVNEQKWIWKGKTWKAFSVQASSAEMLLKI